MKRSPWRYVWTSRGIREKLLMTLGILVIYRLIANIPVPGFNAEVLQAFRNNQSAAGDLLSILNVLSGGTLSNFSILAMGVYPYITASIILQLLGPIIPAIEEKMKNNPREGRQWMEKWTMYLTIPMAFVSALGQIGLFNQIVPGMTVLKDFGWSGSNLIPTLANVLTMMAGTMIAIWLGNIISEYGIQQQGLSLIIFSGIVSQVPSNLVRILADLSTGWYILIISIVRFSRAGSAREHHRRGGGPGGPGLKHRRRTHAPGNPARAQFFNFLSMKSKNEASFSESPEALALRWKFNWGYFLVKLSMATRACETMVRSMAVNRPDSSASGMKAPGGRMPLVGCFHRASVSKPRSCMVAVW